MEQGESYKLVGPLDGSLALLFILPVLAAIGVIVELDSPLRYADPSGFSYVIALTVIFGLASDAYLIFHRRRVRSRRLTVDSVGLSFYEGSRMRWQIDWSELDAVVLRRYTLRYSYFDEAVVFTTKDARARLVPTDSILYGKMPELKAFSLRLREFGHPVGNERRPLWFAPN